MEVLVVGAVGVGIDLEEELQRELVGVLVPVGEEQVGVFIDLLGLHLEGDRFVRLGGENNVLEGLVGGLDVLLER